MASNNSDCDKDVEFAKGWFNFWLRNPDEEELIFSKDSVMMILCFVYGELVNKGKIISIYNLTKEEKDKLKAEAKRINPIHDEKRGMRIVKVIHLFGYLSTL